MCGLIKSFLYCFAWTIFTQPGGKTFKNCDSNMKKNLFLLYEDTFSPETLLWANKVGGKNISKEKANV